MTFESVMRDLKAGRYAPVYILMGEEAYYIDQIADFIAENVLQPEDRDFNQDVVFGSDVTDRQVVNMAKGYPVLPAQHRVVIVKEAQNMRSMDALERYFERPLTSTVLVICYKNGTIDRRKKVVGKAEAIGVVFESKKRETMSCQRLWKAILRVAIQPSTRSLPQ